MHFRCKWCLWPQWPWQWHMQGHHECKLMCTLFGLKVTSRTFFGWAPFSQQEADPNDPPK